MALAMYIYGRDAWNCMNYVAGNWYDSYLGITHHVTRMSATDKPERQQRSLARELGLLLPKLESLRVPIWEGSGWDGICFFWGEKIDEVLKYGW